MSPTSTKPPGCSRRTLVIINLFVVPVAIAGLVRFPDGTADGDMFVLALPMAGRQELLTLLTFIGGLSAATGMATVRRVVPRSADRSGGRAKSVVALAQLRLM
jgi:hypothetical protein